MAMVDINPTNIINFDTRRFNSLKVQV